MKKLYLQTLLLATLAVQPILAHADEWRFGAGHGIYYRHTGEREWRRAPGQARVLGDGWVIGTDRVEGGYGIYRWNGRGWDRAPGAAVQIGGPYQSPWVINDRGERFAWNGYDWRQETWSRGGNGIGRNDRYRPQPRRDDWRDRDHDRDRDNDRDHDQDRDRDNDRRDDGRR